MGQRALAFYSSRRSRDRYKRQRRGANWLNRRSRRPTQFVDDYTSSKPTNLRFFGGGVLRIFCHGLAPAAPGATGTV
jgi:hypothetical protein